MSISTDNPGEGQGQTTKPGLFALPVDDDVSLTTLGRRASVILIARGTTPPSNVTRIQAARSCRPADLAEGFRTKVQRAK